MIFFSEKHPQSTKIYNSLIRSRRYYHTLINLLNARNFKWNGQKDYHYRYYALRKYFRELFPWNHVREGSTVIQVSSAANLIIIGVSQALQASTLVGPKGKVVVFEPDPQSVAILRTYLTVNGVKNVEVIEKGIWNQKTTLKFKVVDKHGSTNTLSEIFTEKQKQQVPDVKEIAIEVDTLDNLIAQHKLTNISVINATINGAEYEAMQGAEKISLQKDIVMAFPLQNTKTFNSPILEFCQKKGFHVLLMHAPVSIYQKQFIVACAVREPEESIRTKGFFPVSLEMTKKENRDFILIKAMDGTRNYDGWVFRKHVLLPLPIPGFAQ